MDLRKEINIINNELLPNSNRTDRLIELFEKYAESLQLRKTDVIPCYFIIRTTFINEEREYSFPDQEIFNEALQRMTEDAEFTDIVWLTGNKV